VDGGRLRSSAPQSNDDDIGHTSLIIIVMNGQLSLSVIAKQTCTTLSLLLLLTTSPIHCHIDVAFFNVCVPTHMYCMHPFNRKDLSMSCQIMKYKTFIKYYKFANRAITVLIILRHTLIKFVKTYMFTYF